MKTIKENGHALMLLTAHRRESFNGGLHSIFCAVKQALQDHPNLFIIYPMHPNPVIKTAVNETGLDHMEHIAIINPLAYSDLIYVLEHCDLVATDSGGIQEEAASLGKPVIVLRNETDRAEVLDEGLAYLAGTHEEKIQQSITDILSTNKTLNYHQLYGNGTASKQIVDIIKSLT